MYAAYQLLCNLYRLYMKVMAGNDVRLKMGLKIHIEWEVEWERHGLVYDGKRKGKGMASVELKRKGWTSVSGKGRG